MKDLYNISEIAGLFNLHPDTLRYYEEKGLLHPVRGENRYRMYTIQDICTLNIIRSLRELDMPVEHIGEYLKRRSVDSTLALIREEEALLTHRMAELEVLRSQAEERRQRLEVLPQECLYIGKDKRCRHDGSWGGKTPHPPEK